MVPSNDRVANKVRSVARKTLSPQAGLGRQHPHSVKQASGLREKVRELWAQRAGILLRMPATCLPCGAQRKFFISHHATELVGSRQVRGVKPDSAAKFCSWSSLR